MSNTEDSVIMNVEKIIDDEPTLTKKGKIKKPRKPMTPEHKEKLLSSLKKAREQSALKRGLKSHAKKIIKAADEAETNDIIRKSLLVKAKAEEDPRDIEIKKLRAKLDGLTLQDVIKKPKPKPKVIIEEPEFEPIDEPDIVIPTPLPSREPSPIPTPKKVTIIEPVNIIEPVIKSKVFKSTRGSKLKRY
tara:strand:- start:443 stop:1009 length:567 start_codon:yes stop_codon:yes gene_type:complete